ncbi:MAG: squalene--hopene cyclase, partial [Candidatus Nealsonbacteria bacterium]|nr:squalene--hopene cyclase [Candidatus Nealsonbacteria bacterium]
SWPIDANLATWTTTLATNALAAANGKVGALGCLDWLLQCQHQRRHPFTHAASGGWGWSDLSGAVPDVDDTAGALLALTVLRDSSPETNHQRIDAAAAAGVKWLLNVQNSDGGWPTFCRGWGTLPFDRSAADLTAHALRALHGWRGQIDDSRLDSRLASQLDGAIRRGFDYLSTAQRPDGSWAPLWFGNQHHPTEENPVYGTARVLLAYRDFGRINDRAAQGGLAWLAASRCPDGGWGGGVAPAGESDAHGPASTEETAVAVEALLADYENPTLQTAIEGGIRWLLAAVAETRHQETAAIGFYFAKLWYYERLYPQTFVVAALGRAVRRLSAEVPPQADDA